MLAGCGGSQPPTGAPSVLPQGPAIVGLTSSAYEVLHYFHLRTGSPTAGLTNINGTLYGTAYGYAPHDRGTVYTISTTGAFNRLYKFHGPDGANPFSSLIDVGGTLYGTTEYGGASRNGAVYSITTGGAENVLYSFKGGSDGANPFSSLIYVGGKLYGTTHDGGSSSCSCGTVYSVSMAGAETVLHRFAGGSDGEYPIAPLVQVNGALYGTTFGVVNGQNYNPGTVYRISTSGSEKTLYAFTGYADGSNPLAPLIAVKGKLYGTTYGGGSPSCPSGTVFSVTTTGSEKVLYSFVCSSSGFFGSDGGAPTAGLVHVNGTFYGTTGYGGSGCPDVGCGVVYSVSDSGSEKVLHVFQSGSDGAHPFSGLIDVDGTLYGTTQDAGKGARPAGTVYALTP
ncbi:MAG: choice-of-anchor tandem repeat GloVer-containing protein [Candidatus Cybelea sp.]